MDEYEAEEYFIRLFEMDTDELVSVDLTLLTGEELEIYDEVLHFRRDEIEEMIDRLENELIGGDRRRKKGRIVLVPAEIVAKLRALDGSEKHDIMN